MSGRRARPKGAMFRRHARLATIVLALLAMTGVLVVRNLDWQAFAATKTTYIPARWTSNGEVPWVKERTKESANFILFWGERAGTDPTRATGDAKFNPTDMLSQLEKAYSFYVNTMKFTPETGNLAKYKINVIVNKTWNKGLDAYANGGSMDGMVGIINISPAAAQPGSWALAHEVAHVFQAYTFMGRSGAGFTDPSSGSFWEASAEFMAMQMYPTGSAGDLTRFIRTENLSYSSSRHLYGAWMLPQYIVDRNGFGMFTRMWNESRNTEHPLETYRRILGISQEELNRQLGQYAQHNVTWDYSNRKNFMPFINQLYPFVTAYNGVNVEAVNASAGHYRIPDAIAPSDYGYNKIKIVPSASGGLIRLHFKGHVNTAAGSGWTYGFVAVKNGTPRYGEVSTAADGQISFQTQAGENEVYLVVTGTPASVHHYAFLDGYPKDYRYPYEFRIDGATPSGFEPGYTKPAAPGGGHWHSNGGGWVDARANVAASVYVGPRAAVYGTSTVSGNARIEDLAWVNDGAKISGNVVVKNSALVQGGANLSGNAVYGGDAEPSISCSSGTYLMFNPDRGCDGKAGETDINPKYTAFTDAELAISGSATPGPSGSTTPSATPTKTTTATATATATATTSATTTATVTAPATVTAVPSRPAATSPGATRAPASNPARPAMSCSAKYTVSTSWRGGFLGYVYVTAGSAPISGWTVTWTMPNGQSLGQIWGAQSSSSGAAVRASNASWNGQLTSGAGTGFSFIASGNSSSAAPTLNCSPR